STFPFRVRLADGAGYMECGTNNSSTGFSRRMECGEGVDALRVPPWLPELNAVSTSSEYVAALTSDGRVLEWNISDPRKFQIREGLSNLVAVTTGMRFTAALSADGTVTGWGQLGPGPFYVPAELSNVVAVAGGNGYCLAL